jgi:hypothetical protein
LAQLSEGPNGIDDIKTFDSQNMRFKLGAEIKNFNAAERLDKMTDRKNDP